MKRLFQRVMILLVLVATGCRGTPLPVTGDPRPTDVIPAGVTPAAVAPGRRIFLPMNSSRPAPPTPTPTSRSPQPPAPTPRPPARATPGPTVEPPKGAENWSMLAGNIERTSWTTTQVSGDLHVEWYRPIEAYIPQNAQIIAGDGLVFVPTSRGLYALNAANGDLVWRFDTALPIGNSPTVMNGVVYVGGYDRQIHALRAADGAHLWSFRGAGAGFSTNPLVVDGKVIAGNRDGAMYAVGAVGAPGEGRLLWRFQTGGMIDLSAAYKNGVVYFASNDNYAYALRASDGAQVWRSGKLPGDGYQSYWPVIYGDKVIFSAAAAYNNGVEPGTRSVSGPDGEPFSKIFDLERAEIFAGAPTDALIGAEVPAPAWANGKETLDASRLTDYTEAKPWRQVLVVLNQSDGSEYTFDSDGDGRAERIPAAMWGTHSGNRYPPIVGLDGTLYFSNILSNIHIPQGRVMGWRLGADMLSQVGGQGAVDEPQAISGGGSALYRSICCDRVGGYSFIDSSGRPSTIWSYDRALADLIPGYDPMWRLDSNSPYARLQGNYGTVNGIYNNHGDQNPLVPYNGRLYIHRSNTVIAMGPGGGPVGLPMVSASPAAFTSDLLSPDELRTRLEAEVREMVDAGHLRPGYYNNGQFNYSQLYHYFENPGDTLYTLSIAYPYLSGDLQGRVRDYLRSEFTTFFDQAMISRTGWADGAAREWMPLPPEVQQSMQRMGPQARPDSRASWSYPPFNFYALWKYAQIAPETAGRAYELARGKLQVPVPIDDGTLLERPFEHNAYIAGYIGFLRLQEMAGRGTADADLRGRVSGELERLQNLRIRSFRKDSLYVDGYGSYHLRVLNISQNFLFMTPELGSLLNQAIRPQVEAAIREYNDVAPYWFATRYNAAVNEGARQNLYDVPAMFQAHAYILGLGRDSLTPYLDVPAFARGDLFYLQNLVAALQAP